MQIMKVGIVLLLLFSILAGEHSQAAIAADKFNLNEQGVILHGYDVVSYFPEGGSSPMMGKVELESSYKGIKFRFANSKTQELFAENPGKYIPAFGGWSATNVSAANYFDIDPQLFEIAKDRIFFFRNQLAVDQFRVARFRPVYLARAEAFWSQYNGNGNIPYCRPNYPTYGAGYINANFAPIGTACRTNTEAVLTKIAKPGFDIAFKDELGNEIAMFFREGNPETGMVYATLAEAKALCEARSMHVPELEEISALAARTNFPGIFTAHGGLGFHVLTTTLWDLIQGKYYFSTMGTTASWDNSQPSYGGTGNVEEKKGQATVVCVKTI